MLAWRKAMKVLALLVVAGLPLFGCTPDFITNNSASVFMEIASIEAASGSSVGGEIRSDVVSDEGSVFNDDANVTVNIFRKNPSVSSTSPLEHTYMDSYEVRYTRVDGHNVEGVDVPFHITGPLGNARVHTPTDTGELEIELPITIVRHAAKLEPPLRNLRKGGGLDLITTVAEVTIYGRQINGQALKATGRVQVTFSDFAG